MILRDIAYARSGDKGAGANIGVIAYDAKSYAYLVQHLTEEVVGKYFKPLGNFSIIRYELPNLYALNFVLSGVLGEGGSRSLRIDSQGKVLGQALLEIEI